MRQIDTKNDKPKLNNDIKQFKYEPLYYLIMSIQSTQKLVLFIDEQYHNYTSGYAITDSSCYVIFDDVEQEYFVCGSRVSRETGGNFAEYHFYCKSKEVLTNYLSFIFKTGESTVNYGIYNYADIFLHSDRIDYTFLNENRSYDSEIALYMDVSFSGRAIYRILEMLKLIRY